MKHKFKNCSLKKKIVVVFCMILVLNAVITTGAYYLFENDNTTEEFQRSSQDMVKQIELYLGEKITNLTQRVTAMGNNLSFADPMRTFLLDEQTDIDPILAGNVARMISEIRTSEKWVDSIFIYTEKGTFDDYLQIRRKDAQFSDTEMYRYMTENPQVNIAWFPAMENPVYERPNDTIPVVYRMKIGNQDVFFVVQLSQKAIQDYLEQAYSSFACVFMVDRSGENILNFSQNRAVVFQKFEEADNSASKASSVSLTLEGKEYLASRAVVSENGWQIYAMMSVNPLTESLRQFRIFLIAENLVVLLLGLIIILWVSNRLTASLEQLAKAMDGAVKSGYHTEFAYPYIFKTPLFFGTLGGTDPIQQLILPQEGESCNRFFEN